MAFLRQEPDSHVSYLILFSPRHVFWKGVKTRMQCLEGSSSTLPSWGKRSWGLCFSGVPSAQMGKGQSLRNDCATASLPDLFLKIISVSGVSIHLGCQFGLLGWGRRRRFQANSVCQWATEVCGTMAFGSVIPWADVSDTLLLTKQNSKGLLQCTYYPSRLAPILGKMRPFPLMVFKLWNPFPPSLCLKEWNMLGR